MMNSSGSLESYAAYEAARNWVTGNEGVATNSDFIETEQDQRYVSTDLDTERFLLSDAFQVLALAVKHSVFADEKSWLDIELTLNPSHGIAYSPFVEIDSRRQFPETLSNLVSAARTLKIPGAKRVARRISELSKIAEEEAPDQGVPSAQSLRNLLLFLVSYPELDIPSLLLTPSGQFRAQWRGKGKNNCVLEFGEDRSVSFVLFSSDPNCPEEMLRMSGRSSAETFVNQAKHLGALDWMRQ